MSPLDDTGQSGLREYTEFLWRRKIMVLLVIILAVGLCLGYCASVKPKYQATTSVLLEPQISSALLQAQNPGVPAALVDVPSTIQIIQSSSVANLVAQQIPNAPDVAVTQVGVTDVVQLQVTSTSPSFAAKVANAYATAYIHFEQKQTLNTFIAAEQLLQKRVGTVQIAVQSLISQIAAASPTSNVAGLTTQLDGLESQEAVLQEQLANFDFYSSQGVTTDYGQVISTAQVPTKASSPKTIEWTIIAGILGIVLGVGLAVLLEALSDKRVA
jgi:uncharacterized protein involved in exopolysaccharide biosynthesis